MASINASVTEGGIVVTHPVPEHEAAILSPQALRFVAGLTRAFRPRSDEVLMLRVIRQKEINAGTFPDFLEHTKTLRESDWRIDPIPAELTGNHTEIQSSSDQAHLARALQDGTVCVADFEDTHSPTWGNCLRGQMNLREVTRNRIGNGACLVVRPRGWHLDEVHVRVDGDPIPAALFDFGLYFFHNAQILVDQGKGLYFCLPKIESHLEARLWNDVFRYAEDAFRFRPGTIRATVLIETVLAAFEMDEILYELREHSAGLQWGRSDYVFSFMKRFRNHREFVLPDHPTLTMDRRFLNATVELMAQTCHRRGAVAVDTSDGRIQVATDDLLSVPQGPITERGLCSNIHVGLVYLESWLRGQGRVEVDDVPEDAASAEVARAQVWQWLRHGVCLEDGRVVTPELVHDTVTRELEAIERTLGPEAFSAGRFETAAKLVEELVTADEFAEFMPVLAGELLD